MLFKTTPLKLETRSHGPILWVGDDRGDIPQSMLSRVLFDHPITIPPIVKRNLALIHKRHPEGHDLSLKAEVDQYLAKWVNSCLERLDGSKSEKDATLCDGYRYGPKDALLAAIESTHPHLYGGECINLPTSKILNVSDTAGKGKKFIEVMTDPTYWTYHNGVRTPMAIVPNDYRLPIDYRKERCMFYDWEVFPNLISVSGMYRGEPFCFYVCKAERDGEMVVVNQVREWVDYIRDPEKVWVGFNSADYDDLLSELLIRLVDTSDPMLTDVDKLLAYFFDISQKIVNSRTNRDLREAVNDKSISSLFSQVKYNPVHDRIDLYRMKPSGGTSFAFSLKHAMVRMGWKRIQDLPYRFDTTLDYPQVLEVLDYNRNDWQGTEKLYDLKLPEIQLRVELGNAFLTGNMMDYTESVMANYLLEKIYCDNTGLSVESLKDLRTHHRSIELSTLFNDKIQFKTDLFKRFYDYLKTVVLIDEEDLSEPLYEKDHKGVTVEVKARKVFGFRAKHHMMIDQEGIRKKPLKTGKNEAYNISLTDYCGIQYDIGVGGIHSVDSPTQLVSTEDEWLIDADVTSFYPYIIILENLVPGHLNDQFPVVVALLKDSRVEMKGRMKKLKKLLKSEKGLTQQQIDEMTAEKNLCDIKQQGQKIVINAISGKFKFNGFWLYDPRCSVKMTLSGQLYLLMLIEDFNMLDGVRIISANTDGVTCAVKKWAIAAYLEKCAQWTAHTGFLLEFATYGQIVRRNINNYLTRSIPGVNVNYDGQLRMVTDTTEDGHFKGNFDPTTTSYDDIARWFNDGNYDLDILQPGKGSPKLKGWFEIDNYPLNLWGDAESEDNQLTPIHKQVSDPIITIAVAKYYLYGIPIADTIYESKNILLFCSAPKGSNQFKNYYDGEDGTEVWIQKTNRVYKAKGGVSIRKREYVGDLPLYIRKTQDSSGATVKEKYAGLDAVPERYRSMVSTKDLTVIKEPVRILNNLADDYLSRDMFSWGINYKWYIGEAQKVLDEIEPPFTQGSLFE
jgi:hypothetical protein